MITPTILVYFGITGDLARLYVIPSLYELYKKGDLKEVVAIIGFSRKEMTKEELQSKISSNVPASKMREKKFAQFLDLFEPFRGEIHKKEDFKDLSKSLHAIDTKRMQCADRLYYAALPPDLYPDLVAGISATSLSHCKGDVEMKLLLEKPFGSTLKEAKSLDKHINKYFKEDQVYRVDHYLAKETVQNILTFRFANSIFEPVWTKDHIESISIRHYESVDVKDRGEFFDPVGQLRDMAQSHLLQMLAMVAIEDPKELDTNAIRTERKKFLSSLRVSTAKAGFARGQYDSYKNTKGVSKSSKTETYFRATLYSIASRWKDVPMYLESGKALAKKQTEIEIKFKEKPTCVCTIQDHKPHSNLVTFRIQPNEGIDVRFWVKRPGYSFKIDERDLSFNYGSKKKLPNAYERVMHDAFMSDQLLFTSNAEVMEQWRIVEQIEKRLQKVPLHIYKHGSKREELEK